MSIQKPDMRARQQTQSRKKQKSSLQKLSQRFMSSFLRSLFLLNSAAHPKQAGFVLPTTVLLLLIVSLTVGAMSFRTFSRTEQTIAYRDQQVIDSLAAPAVDRAKAKIEYLFTQDSTVADKKPPSSDDLILAMAPQANDIDDPYTITGAVADGGETRLDINGDSVKDPVWKFQTEDGTEVVYSIILDDTNNGVSLSDDVPDSNKAANFITRNGPIDTTSPNGNCPVSRLAGNGWQLSGSRLAKNIQVNVLAKRGNDVTKTISASEYQQVRTASRGNRWGAWWRYDMEVAPGAPLRWNGAIHTEGSLVSNKNFIAFMVSSKDSCVYDKDASVIEVSGPVDSDDNGVDDDDFLGQLVSGTITRTGSDSFRDETGLFHTDATARDTAANGFSNGIEKLNASNNKTPRDSVTPKNGGSVGDILQDPIAIFTKDEFVHTDKSRNEDKWDRYPNWKDTGGITRVINDESNATRPFLDDGYRADNRYGPKFAYNRDNTFFKVKGVELADADKHKSGDKITDNSLLTENIPSTDNYGLDGYWERSAASQGLRVVVGQRLELGNTFGWESNNDPLYPANNNFSEMEAKNGTVLKKTSEMLQMRSLRDNLAAVQSMAVYHADDPTNGQYPLACIASVVHPGTADTLKRSRTFNRYSYTAPDGSTATSWKADFLTGNGTNGIEFSPPPASDFNASTGIIASKWVKALENLAYFAGDPKGGAPSFPAVQDKEGVDGFVHPYPYMSMWGDFSILRRLFTDSAFNYTPATKYNELSIADRTTIQTAACTLGMLAHNVSAIEAETNTILTESGGINWSNMGNKIANIVKPNNISNGSPMIGRPLPSDPNYKSPGLCKGTQATKPDYSDPNWIGCPSQNPNDVIDSNDPEYPTNYFANFSSDEWLAALQGNSILSAAQVARIKILVEGSQIERDRTFGFKEGSATGDLSGNFDPDAKIWTAPSSGPDKVTSGQIDPGDVFPMSCDPRVFATTSYGVATRVNSAKARLGLALVVCSTDIKPKYPALYYVFPKFDHGQKGADDSSTSGINIDHTQPSSEDYIRQPYISSSTTGVNRSYTYKAIDTADIALTPYAPNDTEWRTPARAITTSASNDFVFSGGPTFASTVAYNASANADPGNLEKNLAQNIIAVEGASGYSYYQTAFLDKALMDGREMLSVRLMDLDINLLTNVDASDPTSGDTTADITVGGMAWIPEETGIFYAFREDAVREDSIVRPFSKNYSDANAAWNDCNDMSSLTTKLTCHMFLDPTNFDPAASTAVNPLPHDPPLNSETGISAKPVDLFADPDRRPNGFRIINGESLNRTATDSNDLSAGMTFVTDNTIYIKGDFNLHAIKDSSDLEANLIEEFVGSGNLLGSQFAQYGDDNNGRKNARKLFYGRTNLDNRFSDPSRDNWRPVEIFADGITILSNISLDGWIEDYFTTSSPEATNGERGKPAKNSSFLNAHRPWFRPTDASKHASGRWKHEDSNSVLTPIHVDRNGKTFRKVDDGSGDPVEFPKYSDGKNINFYKKSHINAFLFRTTQTQQPSPYANDPVRINALLIGGIVPARDEQSNGGLYNFPRLLEYWPSKELVISGGFFQLNFSSQAASPWDQDAWEPGSPSHSDSNQYKEIGNTGNQITSVFYYGPPKRIWGYDVGFQYTPAGPIARRFFRLDRPRSEFYRELPVDDPYIEMLCGQIGGGC